MKDLIVTVFNILKYAGKTITVFRNIIFNTIFLLVLALILIVIIGEEEVAVTPQSALLLAIHGDLVDEKQLSDPLREVINDSMGYSQLHQETLLQDVLDAITAAAEDRRISSIVLDMSQMGYGSINQLRDIGEALDHFKSKGKPVIAAEDFYTQDKYFLASYASNIFLNPAGLVELHGFGAYRLYFKDALEKLKINYHVFKVGTYKSALEPVTRNSMSEEAKSQNSLWLNALWQEYKKDIIARRGIDAQTIDLYTNNISTLLHRTGGDTAKLALEIKLVDELKTREQLKSYLAGITGSANGNEFRYTTLKEYLGTIPHSFTGDNSRKNIIGIIVAQGNIVPGQQPPGTIGSDSLIEILRSARTNPNIKAVVFRINSGGGSVFASEIIRQEVLELKNSGKPVVVSMGNMAASGGYWIAAEADEIWAYPTTLTGSIGIFGAIPTFEESLAHLGIYSDGTGTTQLASGLDLTRPLSAEIKRAVKLNIEHGYHKFLQIVANGRNIPSDQLDAIAEGRVFDGTTALDIGLVDKLGNLGDAIASAAFLAGLDTYHTEYVTEKLTFSQQLRKYFTGTVLKALPEYSQQNTLLAQLPLWKDAVANLLLFNDPSGVYAHCLIHYY